MIGWVIVSVAIASLAAVRVAASQELDLPMQVGACVSTSIESVETRLSVPGSGSAVTFANGGLQVGYSTVAAIEQSRRGDPVRMCLVEIPKDCPKRDNRGRVYRTTNLRTHQSWTLPDSEHRCGGA